jgi:hypothetical protein
VFFPVLFPDDSALFFPGDWGLFFPPDSLFFPPDSPFFLPLAGLPPIEELLLLTATIEDLLDLLVLVFFEELPLLFPQRKLYLKYHNVNAIHFDTLNNLG